MVSKPIKSILPGSPILRVALGTLLSLPCLAGEGDFPRYRDETAREYVRTVVEAVASGTEGAHVLLSRIQSRMGLNAEAGRMAEAGLVHDPDSVELRLFLADLLIREDRLEEARPLLEEACRIAPGSAQPRIQLGMMLDQAGESEAAREAYRQALSLPEPGHLPHLFLGRSHNESGEPALALPHLVKARELRPNHSNTHYLLWRVLEELGREEEALEALEAFERLREEERLQANEKNRQRDDAADMRGLAASLHLNASLHFLKRGETEEAERHLRQATRIAPQMPRTWEMLARFHQRRGMPQKAKEPMERLVELLPEHAGYRTDLGTLMLMSGDWQSGVAHLEKALESEPDQPQALQNLTRFLLGRGTDRERALELARRLTEAHPDGASHDLLAWASFANGRLEDAILAAREANRLEPANPVYHKRLQQLETLKRD